MAVERVLYTRYADSTSVPDEDWTRSLCSRLVAGTRNRIAVLVLFGYLAFMTWLFHLLWRILVFGSASDIPTGLPMALNGTFFIVFGLFSMWRYQQFLQGRVQEPGAENREPAWTNPSSDP